MNIIVNEKNMLFQVYSLLLFYDTFLLFTYDNNITITCIRYNDSNIALSPCISNRKPVEQQCEVLLFRNQRRKNYNLQNLIF